MKSDPYYQISNFGFTYPNSSGTIQWQGKHFISKGERILLTGASGSGKSTLLYGLMGLLPETIYGACSGDILFNGRSVIVNPDLIRGKAALVLQNPATQMLCKTVREELAFGLENLSKPVFEINENIAEFATQFNIEHLLNRQTAQLSGGEKQKIALLSILMTKPEILMLDEPTAFLDPASAKEIMNILYNLDYENTLIFVEHNLIFLKDIITRNLHLQPSGTVLDNNLENIDWQPFLTPLDEITPGELSLILDNIHFSYDASYLLNGVNLEIHQREIIGIKGKNGSGKSTLLQIIAGFLKPDHGRIVIPPKNHSDHKVLRSLASLLFQNPENHFIYNRVDQELKNTHISYLTKEFENKADQSPFTLSEGEKRRLSSAIACSMNKKILLLDEPTFGQDIPSKKNLITLLGKLRDSDLSIIIVSHDDIFLQAVASRIFELKNGKLNETFQN